MPMAASKWTFENLGLARAIRKLIDLIALAKTLAIDSEPVPRLPESL